MYRVIFACVDAIHAGYTAAVVYIMVGCVYAGCLALLSAKSAVAAFLCVDYGCKKTESRDESEDCSYRTDGVAPSSAVLPCEHSYSNKCNDSNDECRNGLDPDINAVNA